MSDNKPKRGPMGHGPMMGGEKAKDFRGSMGKIINFMKKPKYVYKLIIMLVCAIAAQPLIL